MVPEIALTPLLIGRVQARFGKRVACLHSGLSGQERLREWRRIRAGEADVAVGARSALFAPFPNLGLLIVDEEHDDSYKQGDGVRYHARDMAVVRGIMEKCPVVLASATPSVESWFNAHKGRYELLRINKRATPKPVPKMSLIDMRGKPPTQIIAPEVELALRKPLQMGDLPSYCSIDEGMHRWWNVQGVGTRIRVPLAESIWFYTNGPTRSRVIIVPSIKTTHPIVHGVIRQSTSSDTVPNV